MFLRDIPLSQVLTSLVLTGICHDAGGGGGARGGGTARNMKRQIVGQANQKISIDNRQLHLK